MGATIVCKLVNHATRIYLQHHSVSLETAQFWTATTARRLDWTINYARILLFLGFVIFSAAPAAVWAGALTPVATTITSLSSAALSVPQYNNTTLVREYSFEADTPSPDLRTKKGYFLPKVGMEYLGKLLSSAATATPSGGSPRNHSTIDETGFVYVDRFYGASASVGLADDFTANARVERYSCQEAGYNSVVDCIHNLRTAFVPDQLSKSLLYSAAGGLPNSGSAGKYSRYVGDSKPSIVAIGVVHDPIGSSRYLAISARESYALLSTIQCRFEVEPALFEISVMSSDVSSKSA